MLSTSRVCGFLLTTRAPRREGIRRSPARASLRCGLRRCALALGLLLSLAPVAGRAASFTAQITSANPFVWNDYARAYTRFDIAITNTSTAAAAIYLSQTTDLDGATGRVNASLSELYSPNPMLAVGAGQTSTLHVWILAFTGDARSGPPAGTYRFNLQLTNSVDGTTAATTALIQRSYPVDGATGMLSGRVTDAVSGVPLNATVYWADPNSYRSAVQSNQQAGGGSYSTPPVLPGTYWMWADAAGYKTQFVGNVTVGAGATTVRNFTLSSATVSAGSTTPAGIADTGQPIYSAAANADFSRIAVAPGFPPSNTGMSIQAYDGNATLLWQSAVGAEATMPYDIADNFTTDMVVDMSGDGTMVAAGTQDGKVTVFDAASGTKIWSSTFPGVVNPVVPGPWGQGVIRHSHVRFSPDSSTLVIGAATGLVLGVAPRTGQIGWSYPTASQVYAITFAPDGSRVYLGNADTLFALNRADGSLAWSNPALLFWPFDNNLAITANGGRLATGGKDGVLRVFNSADGSLLWSRAFGSYVQGVNLSPDGEKVIATIGAGNGIYAFGPTGQVIWYRRDLSPPSLPGVFVDPQGRFIAECLGGSSATPSVQVLDFAGTPVWSYKYTGANPFTCRQVGLFGDGSKLFATGSTVPTVGGNPSLTISDGTFAVFRNFAQVAGATAALSLSATSAAQGTGASVTLTGIGTHFTPQSVVNFGSGIAVTSTSAVSATSIAAVLAIDPATALGPRDVTVTTGGEIAGRLAGFSVSGAVPPRTGWHWIANKGGVGAGIEQQSNGRTIVAIFDYDASGAATWSYGSGTLTGPQSTVSLSSFSGGTPWGQAQPQAPHAVATRWPGSVFLWPISYQPSITISANQSVPLAPFQFNSDSSLAPIEIPPGFYWQASESGTGYFVEQQGNHVFLAAFTYTASGQPDWIVATLTASAPGHYAGSWSRYAGGCDMLTVSTGCAKTVATTSGASDATVDVTGADAQGYPLMRLTMAGTVGSLTKFSLP